MTLKAVRNVCLDPLLKWKMLYKSRRDLHGMESVYMRVEVKASGIDRMERRNEDADVLAFDGCRIVKKECS